MVKEIGVIADHLLQAEFLVGGTVVKHKNGFPSFMMHLPTPLS